MNKLSANSNVGLKKGALVKCAKQENEQTYD